MKAYTTVLFNGVVGAVADVALNDLSRARDFAHLRAYFRERSICGAAGAASVTVMIGAVAVLAATSWLFGFDTPSTPLEVAATLFACFAIGFGMDVAIARLRVFRGLEAYYEAHGAGVWGGLSLVVSMAVALVVQAYVLPSL